MNRVNLGSPDFPPTLAKQPTNESIFQLRNKAGRDARWILRKLRSFFLQILQSNENRYENNVLYQRRIWVKMSQNWQYFTERDCNMTGIEQFLRITIKSCQNIKIHNTFIKEWRSTVFHTILPPRNLMKHSKLISPYRISPAREFANVINYILPPTLHFWKRLYNKLYPLFPFSFSIPSGAQTTGKQLETLSFRASPSTVLKPSSNWLPQTHPPAAPRFLRAKWLIFQGFTRKSNIAAR